MSTCCPFLPLFAQPTFLIQSTTLVLFSRGKYYKDWEKETLKQQSEVEEAKRRVLEAEQKLKEAKEKQGEVSSHATRGDVSSYATSAGGVGGKEGEAKAPDSRPSDPRYHHDVYSEHHPPSHHEPRHEPHHEAARHEPHHEEHLDPLDASFMHGEVSLEFKFEFKLGPDFSSPLQNNKV